MVSFPGTEDSAPVPVPANRLYLRVTNEALDHDMSQVDKDSNLLCVMSY